jgi:WD40 repeat protein
MKLYIFILLLVCIGCGRIVPTSAPSRVFEHDVAVLDLAFRPGSDQLAVLAEGGLVEVWNFQSNIKQWHIVAASDTTSLQFSTDGSLLFTVGDSGSISTRDAQTGALQLEWQPTNVPEFWLYRSVALSADGQWLAMGGGNDRLKSQVSSNGLLSVWNVRTGEQHTDYSFSAISGITFSPDSRILALSLVMDTCGRGGGGLGLLDVDSWERIGYFSHDGGSVQGAVFSADQRLIAGAGTTSRCFGDPVIWLWDTHTAEVYSELPNYTTPLAYHDSLLGASYCPQPHENHMLCDVQEIRLWDVQQRKHLAVLAPSTSDDFTNLVFSPDGKWLAAATETGRVEVWSIR